MNKTLPQILLLAALTSLANAADWPQFLGPERDGVYPGEIRATLPEDELQPLWTKDVGEGFAAPSVAGGHVFLFHRRDGTEIIEALEAATGKPVWTYGYPTTYRDDFGFDEGPRSAPTVHGNRVYTYGAQGMIHCLDSDSGRKVWSVDTKREFGPQKGYFGAACAPLVEDGKVIVNVGGSDGAGIVAFDADSGDVAWKATDHPAGYSSPVAATFDGERRVFVFTRTGLVSLDPAAGRVHWQLRWRSRSNASVNAAVPLVFDGLIFLSASYGTGAALLRIGDTAPEQLWASDDILSNHYATSVRKGDYLYGYHGRQEFGPSLRCVEIKTGKVMWSEDGFRAGTITLAGTHILLVRESGELVIADATPTAYHPTASAKLLPATIRAHPALANGILYVRNEQTLAAFTLHPE